MAQAQGHVLALRMDLVLAQVLAQVQVLVKETFGLSGKTMGVQEVRQVETSCRSSNHPPEIAVERTFRLKEEDGADRVHLRVLEICAGVRPISVREILTGKISEGLPFPEVYRQDMTNFEDRLPKGRERRQLLGLIARTGLDACSGSLHSVSGRPSLARSLVSSSTDSPNGLALIGWWPWLSFGMCSLPQSLMSCVSSLGRHLCGRSVTTLIVQMRFDQMGRQNLGTAVTIEGRHALGRMRGTTTSADLDPVLTGMTAGPTDLGPTDLGTTDLGTTVGTMDPGQTEGKMDLGTMDLGLMDGLMVGLMVGGQTDRGRTDSWTCIDPGDQTDGLRFGIHRVLVRKVSDLIYLANSR